MTFEEIRKRLTINEWLTLACSFRAPIISVEQLRNEELNDSSVVPYEFFRVIVKRAWQLKMQIYVVHLDVMDVAHDNGLLLQAIAFRRKPGSPIRVIKTYTTTSIRNDLYRVGSSCSIARHSSDEDENKMAYFSI